ncbi:Rap1a/Tai family immunity protein [Skermanella stibiiresistens]|uniref:Rap1a/Tai family immunity protein n=1 Tax=Skermanella stibiiresistens TaxID=913326 RepID=UPI0012FB4B90|nr:Rap1a/Tai family immunity protein [Skermanella stibiiresistens]
MRAVAVVVMVALGLMSSVPGNAQGYYQNGNSLLAMCQGEWIDKTYCLGYVTAAAELAAHDGYNGLKACIPSGVLSGQLMDTSVQYLIAHPERRHLPSFALVSLAIVLAFPCR